MKTIREALIVLLGVGAMGADWKIAEPGWQYEFPRDHRPHTEFKTEWWYFTGNLFDTNNRRFGYELTFFRQGIRPPAARDEKLSRFVINDLKFAHFALTDVSKRRFRFAEKTSRGAFGEAGFDDGNRLAWVRDWSLGYSGDGLFELVAEMPEGKLRLELRESKGPIRHGENGVSVKANAPGHASHYYSIPRLQTSGELFIEGESHQVRGESWFDHEWATGQLAVNQVGWDWVSLQWEDGSELMLYQMRLNTGEADASSSGSWIAPDGKVTHLRSSDFRMTPVAFWTSKSTGARYPIGWRVSLGATQTEFLVKTAVEDQELALGSIAYWEGAIDANGSRGGKPIKGKGYLELTGYAGKVGGLGR